MEPLFFDRDIGRRVPEALRLMGVEVVAHRERYQDEHASIADDLWIPRVGAEGYVIITHDSRIRRRTGEWGVFQAAGARCFALATNRPHRFTHLRALLLGWAEMERILAIEVAPFMYGLQATGKLTRYVGPKTA